MAHLAFYPACNFQLIGELKVADAPIREFHGTDDDWTLAATCRAYIDRLAAAGSDAMMTEYEGALHAFDSPRNPARFSNSDNQTSRNCMRKEVDGKLLNVATGGLFAIPSCSSRPASIMAPPQRRRRPRRAVLEEVFGRN